MKKINEHQMALYESFASHECLKHLKRYLKYLGDFKSRRNLKILDIGGGTGHFASVVMNYYKSNDVEVYVIDPVCEEALRNGETGVNFICDSAENLSSIFEENTFDIIFANRVFHHFVQSSWQKSLKGMDECMHAIYALLKNDGLFCVMDHFYDGAILDWGSSLLCYTFTSIKEPHIAKILKRMGAESAGVGTCFLSEKMWKDKLERTGFDILHIEKTMPDAMTISKRILLFKEARRDNIIISRPRK